LLDALREDSTPKPSGISATKHHESGDPTFIKDVTVVTARSTSGFTNGPVPVNGEEVIAVGVTYQNATQHPVTVDLTSLLTPSGAVFQLTEPAMQGGTVDGITVDTPANPGLRGAAGGFFLVAPGTQADKLTVTVYDGSYATIGTQVVEVS
jgi:hypothetical protein